MNTITTPKFRRTSRLIKHVEKYGQLRLPQYKETCFFTSKEDAKTIAINVSIYAGWTGKLEERFENLLDEKSWFRYIRNVILVDGTIDPSYLDKLDVNSILSLVSDYGEYPEHIEKKFEQASQIVFYLAKVKKYLSTEQESIVLACKDDLFNHICNLHSDKMEIPEKYFNEFIGDNEKIKFFSLRSIKIPIFLENSINDPSSLLTYAQNVKRRASPKAEECLVTDSMIAIDYAYRVIRPFSSIKLPDFIHNSIIFSSSNNIFVKEYIEEVEFQYKNPIPSH